MSGPISSPFSIVPGWMPPTMSAGAPSASSSAPAKTGAATAPQGELALGPGSPAFCKPPSSKAKTRGIIVLPRPAQDPRSRPAHPHRCHPVAHPIPRLPAWFPTSWRHCLRHLLPPSRLESGSRINPHFVLAISGIVLGLQPIVQLLYRPLVGPGRIIVIGPIQL